MASNKDLNNLIKTAKKQGWTVDRTERRYKWTSPKGGVPYFSSINPSDGRAVRNMTADLRKMGLSV